MGWAGSLFRQASRLVGRVRASRSPPQLPLAPGARVLLSRADHLGDLLMVLPALEALHRRGLEVDVLVKRPYAPLLEGHPHIASVHGLTLPWQDPHGRGDGWGAVATLRRSLRERGYVAALEATEDLRSQGLLASLGARWVVGWELPGSSAYLDDARRPQAEHQVDRTLELVQALGASARGDRPQLPHLPPAPTRAGVLLHPGAAGPRKAWPLERFQELAAALRAEGEAVAFVLGPAEAGLRESLAGEEVRPSASLLDLATHLGAARAFVGNDSGPAHLAAAVGTPTTVVFGPTMPSRTAPRGEDVRVVAAALPCQPCWAPRTRFHCPTARECLADLPLEPVLTAVRAQLARR